MSLLDPLRMHLLDLLSELRKHDLPLTIGGGFGLYLKREQVEQSGERTLLDYLPQPRATNDLDLFIPVDILVDLERMKLLAEVIDHLGYEVVDEAKYMQWKKETLVRGVPQEIKLDLLVGPLGVSRQKLHVRAPRVRPRGTIRLHAHAVEEAVHIDEEPFEATISGMRSSGDVAKAKVFIPHPFPYMMMKLFAFCDRKEDDRKDLGRHHALDLYHIVGMMIENEYQRTMELGQRYGANKQTGKAREIVRECFSNLTDIGLLRLREHTLFREEFQLAEFIDVLAEVFRTSVNPS